MNSLRKNDLKVFVLAVILYGVLFGLMETGVLNTFWEYNLVLLGINIILAVSLNLINGYTGQFSLGHAGFMAVGAYTAVVLTTKFGFGLPLGLIAGGATAAALGALIGVPTLRLRGDYLAIATLGLGEIVRILIINIDYIGGAAGFRGIPKLTNFTWVFAVMLVTLFVIKNFVNSNHGRACMAIRENEIAAEAMGINTTLYKILAFTIGAGIAGVAGGLFAHTLYIITPASFTFMASFNYLIMVVMGGLGSITGSIAGAFVVTILSAALADWPSARMIIYALVLILLMFYRPQGLFGHMELTSMRPFRRFFSREREQ